MTLKPGLLRNKNKQCKSKFCDGLQSHSHSENSLFNNSLNRLPRPQLLEELLKRKNEIKQIFLTIYQRCLQITSKALERRNRYKLGKYIKAGQKVFLENEALDLTKFQKLKHLPIGSFTVTRQITNTTYGTREAASHNNVQTTHKNHLIRYLQKQKRLSPFIINYAVTFRDSDFYKHSVNSQIELYNSGREKLSLDVMPFVLAPLQNNSNKQQKDNAEFSLRAHFGIQSPENSRQQSPRSQNLSP